jgi:hypothetical protein
MRTADWPCLSIFRSKKRKLYYLEKEDFYHSLNALNVASAFSFNKQTSHGDFNTAKPIKFYRLEFGASVKDAKKLFGKPNFIQHKNLPLKSQQTLFYKFSIKGIKSIIQMHFYEDELFFAQIQLRSHNNQLKDIFLNLFKIKHALHNLDWNQTVKDESGNTIILKDDVTPKVSFVSYNQALWSNINHELNHLVEKNNNYSIYNTPQIALRWS